MKPNFNEIRIHCSSLGKLLTEPKSKQDKEEGNLSATAKTHLIEIYAQNLYNFRKELNNKYVTKGNEVEKEGIDALSIQVRYPMEKNEEVFINEFLVGTPDVITQNMVFDVKSSFDWITFLSNVPSELDPMYVAQVNGYLDLLGYDTGYIAYVLLDTPESIRNKEKFYLLSSMDVISEESPAFVKAWEEKEKNMIFKGSWLTRILGIAIILQAVSSAVVALLDNDPSTVVNTHSFLFDIGVGWGIAISRQNNVTSEAAGAKPVSNLLK